MGPAPFIGGVPTPNGGTKASIRGYVDSARPEVDAPRYGEDGQAEQGHRVQTTAAELLRMTFRSRALIYAPSRSW